LVYDIFGGLILAQVTQSVTQPPEFDAYRQWPLVAATVALCAFMMNRVEGIFKRDTDVDAATLSLEQVASSFFVALVLKESRRLFNIVDDHLPIALSQAHASVAERSRFFQFCVSLRAIPEEELDDRGKYAQIIKESFARIICDSAERLIDSIGASPSVLNPTAVRFSLEGDGYLSFAGVASFDYQNRRLANRFQMQWSSSALFAFVTMICGIATIVGVIFNEEWAQHVTWWALVGVALALVATVLLYGLSFVTKRAILNRAKKYCDANSVSEFINNERREHASKV